MMYFKTAQKVIDTFDVLESIDGPFPFMAIAGLASTVREVEDDELDENGDLLDECESNYLMDRLTDAYDRGQLKEQYIEELLNVENYELLKLIG